MLLDIIRDDITQNGPMRLDTYMEKCLYHPQFGYYTSHQPFGRTGDFITAPHLTNLFGMCIAHWLYKAWDILGKPGLFNIVESGVGDGTLMHDVLTTLSTNFPHMLENARIYAVDINQHNASTVTQTRTEKLSTWDVNHTTDTFAADYTLPTLFYANELLDAFPIRQLKYTHNTWWERHVNVGKDTLLWDWLKAEDYKAPKPPKEDFIYEFSPPAQAFMKQFKKRLMYGKALFIDYTGGTGDTLQAVKEHAFTAPLETPGKADLTAHVPFSSYKKILGEQQCALTPMGAFLLECGLAGFGVKALEQETRLAKKQLIEQSLQRLVAPRFMGNLFACLEFSADIRK